jgi:hypothetical protein
LIYHKGQKFIISDFIYIFEGEFEMDLENVPIISISKEKRDEIRKQIRLSIEEGDQYFDEWVARMRKSGYSDEDIDNALYY